MSLLDLPCDGVLCPGCVLTVVPVSGGFLCYAALCCSVLCVM